MKVIEFNNLTNTEKRNIVSVIKIAQNSSALKRQVGAMVTSGISMLGIGWNHNNEKYCESPDGETYSSVIHAESQAIFDMYQQNHQSRHHYNDAKYIFCTYSPCMDCCKQIVLAKISKIYFIEKHPINFDNVPNSLNSPLEFLNRMGVKVYHVLNVPKLSFNKEIPNNYEESTN